MGTRVYGQPNCSSGDLRKRLLDILHFGHTGMTKMTAEAKIFWWPEIKRDIEKKMQGLHRLPCIK